MLSCTHSYRNKIPGLLILLYCTMYGLRIAAQDTIAGRVYTIDSNHHTNAGQPGIKMLLYASSKTVDSSITDSNGNYRFLIEGDCNNLRVQPSAEGLPLPQPDSWDAVLIMQHILGIQPFTTRSQFIRADMNGSGSITTFDIVSLRRRIFDPEKKEAGTPVWRFYDAALPEKENGDFLNGMTQGYRIASENMLPATHFDFVACTPGIMGKTPENGQKNTDFTSVLRVEGPYKPADDLLQFDVYYDGPAPALALQLALHFDPEAMTLLGPAPGADRGLTAANFDLSKTGSGHIGFLWQATDIEQIPLDSGNLLFHLIFKMIAGRNRPKLELPVQTAPTAAAWSPEGQKIRLQPLYQSVPTDALPNSAPLFIYQANPGEPVTLVISDTRPGKVRVVISGAFGERLSLRDIMVESGPQKISLPEADALKAGIYQWWVKLPGGGTHNDILIKH